MIREHIKELLERAPSAAFRPKVPSRKHNHVLNPARTVLLKAERFAPFPEGEHITLIPLFHVTSVDTKRKGRGSGRGRRK